MIRLNPLVLLSLFALGAVSSTAQALSIDWGGTYRFEYTSLSSSTMTGAPLGQGPDFGQKSYFLNHLNLTPKIIAMDGVNIVSNIEVFPSTSYPGSQLGTDFGSSSSQPNQSGTINQTSWTANIEVNQLYMTWNQEYGELAVGRMPVQFGLGISYNSGAGMFDHWLETHDLITYKVIMGNLSVTPMIGHTNITSGFAGEQGTEYMLNVDYTNPETESTFAIMHQIRNAGTAANDSYKFFAPYEQNQNGTYNMTGGLSTTLTSLYIARGWEKFKFKMEAGFQSGNTNFNYNLYAGSSQNVGPVGLSGYGIAIEMEFPRPDSKWNTVLRTGIASGDNPQTANFEGFYFNRNYDIAMILFNQVLGQNTYDVLRTQPGRQRSGSIYTTYSNSQTADEEYLSNAIYLSPKFDMHVADHWYWTNALTYAIAQTNPTPASDTQQKNVGSDLGLEYDTGVSYRPHSRFQWNTRVGLFNPGSVWREGSGPMQRDVMNFVWGFNTQAGVTF